MSRLLVVEDSPTQAKRLALILQDAGFDVETAPDADRGFARLAEQPFDLVLSDLLLPGDSGFDLCRRIKAEPRLRHVPVVVLTSQADPANVLRGLEAGADGFMTKDRAPADLVNGIRHALRDGSGRAPEVNGKPLRVGFLNQEFVIAAGREQLLNVLASAFEDVVHLNRRLQSANADLAESNRSERAAHEALKQAQCRLVQSEKLASLGQLAAGMAHEINNPLTYVSNNLAVLHRDSAAVFHLLDKYRAGRSELERVAPQHAAECAELEEEIDLAYIQNNLDRLLQRSLEGLHRMREIVKNLRDFARLDEAEFKEADVNAALGATVEMVQHERNQRQVEVVTRFESLPVVLCQPGKLNQVFLNVILNAVQACGPGGRVEVRSRAEPDAVVVEVEDDGSGIRPEHLPRLFEPFFTTKPVGQGTGLGLSISYGIIEEHGGTIAVESEVGRGSLFRIRLPLRRP
jgi:signal transduction histidine kinase